MSRQYLTVRSAGFITYCDALIARSTGEHMQAYFISLIGTPAHIKASTATLFSGETCRIAHQDEPPREIVFPGSIRTCRSRKIGETVNKIMVSGGHFSLNSGQASTEAVVFGPDIGLVQERAFLRLDAATGIPLKTEWQEWLWDEVLQPEKLYSFGEEELQEAYLVRWPEDSGLQEQILAGVKQRYLS